MRQFIVWCPGRCGSRLVTQVIQNHYATEYPRVFYTDYHAKTYDVDLPIIHTHSVDLILSDIVGYEKVAIHRNIFDSVTSKIIMDHTNKAHIDDEEDEQSFIRRYSNRKFIARLTDFEHYCRLYDEQYSRVLASQDIKILSYEQFQDDPNTIILKELDSDVTVDYGLSLTRKIPLDKSRAIANLDELIQIYDRLDLRYKRLG